MINEINLDELIHSPETLGNFNIKDDPDKFCAFYADIPHKHIDEILEDLHNHYHGKKTYLIGLEYKDAREHYHFVIDFTDKEYASYVKRVLKGKYKLSGRRSKKGHTGQFGKVGKIRDIDLMCSYTLKDLDFRTNFKEELQKELKEKSYPKPDNDRDIMDECMDYIKKQEAKNVILSDADVITQQGHLVYGGNYQIAVYVIDFLRTKKRDLVATQIRRYTLRYLTYYSGGTGLNSDELFRILFPHGL